MRPDRKTRHVENSGALGNKGKHVFRQKGDMRKFLGYRGHPEIHENRENRTFEKKTGYPAILETHDIPERRDSRKNRPHIRIDLLHIRSHAYKTSLTADKEVEGQREPAGPLDREEMFLHDFI